MKELTADQKQKVIKILSENAFSNLSESEITEETNIKVDLGFDSLDEVEVIMEIEKQFDCEIKDDHAETIFHVKDYFRVLAEIIN